MIYEHELPLNMSTFIRWITELHACWITKCWKQRSCWQHCYLLYLVLLKKYVYKYPSARIIFM